MKFSYLFATVVAVLFVFTSQAEGGIIEALSKSTKAEKFVTEQKFQDEQQALIMEGKDEDNLDAKKAIEDIQEIVKTFPVYVVAPDVVGRAMDGIFEAIRLINAVIHQGNEALDAASLQVKAQNTDKAIEIIKNGLTADRELVFIAGVPIHDAQGAALAMVGGLSLPGLRNTIISIQKSGSSIFEILEIADELATAGIKTGGLAAEEAIISARNVLRIGSKAIYSHFNDAATNALEGITKALSKAIGEVDLMPGIVDSLKTPISTNDSAALDAVSKISNGLSSALSVLTKKPLIDAANVLSEGLKSTILETADAVSVAEEAVYAAAKHAVSDPEGAIALLRTGIQEAKNKLLSGSAYGYLAVGAAGQIAGKSAEEGLVPSVLEIEYGRVTAYEDFALAERAAVVGIRGGRLAAIQGLGTAIQICDTAAQTLYQDYAEAGEMGFELLKRL